MAMKLPKKDTLKLYGGIFLAWLLIGLAGEWLNCFMNYGCN